MNNLKDFIIFINPTLTDEEVEKKALEVKEKFEKDITINIFDNENNPFLLIMFLLLGYPESLTAIKNVMIKSFKDETGVEATFEDVKLYEDLKSKINTYQTIKDYLEKDDIDRSNIPPILIIILSCKDVFITPLNNKINELLKEQENIINKYKNHE